MFPLLSEQLLGVPRIAFCWEPGAGVAGDGAACPWCQGREDGSTKEHPRVWYCTQGERLRKACSLDWFKVGVHKVCAAPSLSWAVHEIDNVFILYYCFEVDCYYTLLLTLHLLLISARDAHLSLVMPPVSPEPSCCFGPIDLDLTYVRNFGLYNLFPELLGVLPRCRLCAYYYFQRNVLYL